MNFETLSREQLASMLEALLEQRDQHRAVHSRELESRDRLLNDLQVHQVELEMQNRELREAQAQLERAKDRYATLYDHAPVAYFTFDLHGTVTEVNLSGASMVGLLRERVLGMPFVSLVRFTRTSEFHGHLAECERSRDVVHGELAFDVHQRLVHVEAVTVPVLDERGNVQSYRTTFTDITRRKQAEIERERALEAERTLRTRFEVLDDANLVFTGALATSSIDITALLGLVAERAKSAVAASDAWVELEKGIAEQSAKARAPRNVQGMTHTDLPVVYRGRQLATLHLLGARPELSTDEHITLSMLLERAACAIEVARLSQVETRERERLCMVELATQELALALDTHTAWEAVGRVATRISTTLADVGLLYAATEEDLVPVTCTDALAARMEAAGLTPLHLTVPRNHEGSLLARSVRDASPIACNEPSLVWHDPAASLLEFGSLLVVPLVSRQRAVGALYLARQDAASTYQDAEIAQACELASMCAIAIGNATLFEEMQAAVRSRESLLALVSHDLRGPLNAIALTASSLGAPGSEATTKQRVELIVRSARWMETLLDDLLVENQMAEGYFAIAPQWLDGGRLLTEAVRFAMPLAQHESIRLETVLPDRPLPLYGDQVRLLQVLSNLLANAIKYTPTKQTVRAEVAESAAGEVLFSVADSGPGVPPHQRARIFERYWTASNAGSDERKRTGRGLGLGLFIAKNIVEAHLGRIWVESTVGQGATFYVALPLPQAATA